MDTKFALVLNIKCSNKGLLFIICLILNLSLNGMITEPGKLITFPLNVIVTDLQSISIHIPYSILMQCNIFFICIACYFKQMYTT